jgi:hypothetical protein
VQEAFMSYSAFVLHDGLRDLVPALLPGVQAAAAQHGLTDSLSVEQARHPSITFGGFRCSAATVLLALPGSIRKRTLGVRCSAVLKSTSLRNAAPRFQRAAQSKS